eukprot:6175811-Pleurochrysis_carterae.AAC.6
MYMGKAHTDVQSSKPSKMKGYAEVMVWSRQGLQSSSWRVRLMPARARKVPATTTTELEMIALCRLEHCWTSRCWNFFHSA